MVGVAHGGDQVEGVGAAFDVRVAGRFVGGQRTTDDVLVLDRHDRNGHPGEPADVAGGGAGRVDDDLGGDASGVGHHRADSPAGDIEVP